VPHYISVKKYNGAYLSGAMLSGIIRLAGISGKYEAVPVSVNFSHKVKKCVEV